MKMIAAVLACSCAACLTTDPPAGVTLLVTNATCSGGGCAALQVGAILPNGVPTPTYGNTLGRVNSASACLTIPQSASTDSMYLIAVDPGTLAPVGLTRNFLPQAAPGWSVTFPGTERDDGGSVPLSAVVPTTPPCTP
jgi:hypothetical protein